MENDNFYQRNATVMQLVTLEAERTQLPARRYTPDFNSLSIVLEDRPMFKDFTVHDASCNLQPTVYWMQTEVAERC